MITYQLADRERDFEFARHVHHTAYHDVVVRQFGSWNESMQDDFFKAAWREFPHYLMSRDGVVVGIVSYIELGNTIHVNEIQIVPHYQGQGIGTAFLTERIEEARHRKIPLTLQVLRENRAIELYRRLGFVPYAESDTHIKMEWRTS